MTDDLPKIFEQCTPRPAPPELRTPVLAAVDRELKRRRKPRWERAFELAVAASLLVGVGLNVWLWRAEDAGQVGITERRPPGAGQSAQHEPRAAGQRQRGKQMVGNDRYQRLLHELSQGRPPKSL